MCIYAFNNDAGLEGWFSLIFRKLGEGWIDPERDARRGLGAGSSSFIDVLPAIIEVARGRTDLLSMRGRVGFGLRDGEWGSGVEPCWPRKGPS